MFELGAVRTLSGELQSNRICRVLLGICQANCDVLIKFRATKSLL